MTLQRVWVFKKTEQYNRGHEWADEHLFKTVTFIFLKVRSTAENVEIQWVLRQVYSVLTLFK